MITGFIPINLWEVDQSGKMQKIKFVEVHKYAWCDGFIIHQYYQPNYAVSKKITQSSLNNIRKYREGNSIELYQWVFNLTNQSLRR